ncbi:MAG: UDP-4-amino-4,6-dideoxy-N-acetyl-beta-L-altrosamine transaminase [Sedimenticolaceae bacterium]
MISYGRQSISQSDIDAVVEILRGDWLTQGPTVARFEQAVADYCGTSGAVAVSSGTAALHLACRSLGFGSGDVLWTSPNTFVSSANCALFCGGDVDFVDIDPRSYNLCPDALERKLQKAGRLPKIVMPVHFAGQSCDMPRIWDLAGRYGFKVVEDASHALGGRYLNCPVGSCRYSDITVFSFHPLKSITTGEGGMAMTNDLSLRRRMVQLRSHGIDREPRDHQAPALGAWCYEQTALGYNYRMTDIQAALGVSQLGRLDAFVARRHGLAARYDDLLSGLAVGLPWQDERVYSARHLYPIQLHGGGEMRRSVFDRLRANGIGVQVHYIPVHTQPFYRARGFARGDFPVAEAYYERAMSLPLFPDLTHAQQDSVVAELRRALQMAQAPAAGSQS